jgi:hypothetical protein
MVAALLVMLVSEPRIQIVGVFKNGKEGDDVVAFVVFQADGGFVPAYCDDVAAVPQVVSSDAAVPPGELLGDAPHCLIEPVHFRIVEAWLPLRREPAFDHVPKVGLATLAPGGEVETL